MRDVGSGQQYVIPAVSDELPPLKRGQSIVRICARDGWKEVVGYALTPNFFCHRSSLNTRGGYILSHVGTGLAAETLIAHGCPDTIAFRRKVAKYLETVVDWSTVTNENVMDIVDYGNLQDVIADLV